MIIKNLLASTQLAELNDCLSKEFNWSSHQLTGNTKDFSFKHNKEYIGEDKPNLDKKIINALNVNEAWRDYVVAPKLSGEILFLKYEKNSLYKYHADVAKGSPVTQTYSNTLFLSDPEEYEGGELVLTINNEEIEYKLPRNTLLTYPVGCKHRVNKVTEGTRKVAIFWTESWIKDESDRNLIRDLSEIYNQLYLSYEELNLTNTQKDSFRNILIDLTRLTERIHNKYPRWRDPRNFLLSD